MSVEMAIHLLRNSSKIPDSENVIAQKLLNNCHTFDIMAINRRVLSTELGNVPIANEFIIVVKGKTNDISKDDILDEIKTNVFEYDAKSYIDLTLGTQNFIQRALHQIVLNNFKLEDDNKVNEYLKSNFSNPEQSANDFYKLAELHCDSLQFNDALVFFKKAYQLYKIANNDSIHSLNAAKCLNGLSACALKLNNSYTATILMEQACLILSLNKETTTTMRCEYFTKLADLFVQNGEYESANNWYSKALSLIISEEQKVELTTKVESIKTLTTDNHPNAVPNPYGVRRHLEVENVEVYQRGVTQTTTIEDNVVEAMYRFSNLETFMKPVDPAKFQLLLDDALEATRKDNDIKVNRLIMMLPVEQRYKVREYLNQNGIYNITGLNPTFFARPFTLTDSYVRDEHDVSETIKRRIA